MRAEKDLEKVNQFLADWKRAVQAQNWDEVTDQLMVRYPAVVTALKNVLEACAKADRLEKRWIQPTIQTGDVRKAIVEGLGVQNDE